MRCAALHRKLGTHVSKVKSLSMDSWSNDQVEVSVHGSAFRGEWNLTLLAAYEAQWQSLGESSL